MKAKAILVLGGGAAWGLAHIGVLSVLEQEYEISGIIGTSMGAIVGALYSLGRTPHEILQIAENHKNAKVISPLGLDRHISGIFDGSSLLSMYRGWTENKQIEEGLIPFIACAYDLRSRSTVLFRQGKYADALRASSSLPYIFAPYSYGDYLFVDGGVEHPLPLAFANLLNGDLVIAVNVLPLVNEQARYFEPTEAPNLKHRRVHRTEVVMQSVFQNQAYLSLQDINRFAPDIVIDAAMAEGKPIAFHKAKSYYQYGREQAKKTLQSYAEPRFLPQIRRYYRKLVSKANTLSRPKI